MRMSSNRPWKDCAAPPPRVEPRAAALRDDELEIAGDASGVVDLQELEAGGKHLTAGWADHLPVERDDFAQRPRVLDRAEQVTRGAHVLVVGTEDAFLQSRVAPRLARRDVVNAIGTPEPLDGLAPRGRLGFVPQRDLALGELLGINDHAGSSGSAVRMKRRYTTATPTASANR